MIEPAEQLTRHCIGHILERLAAAEPCHDPYPHFWVTEFLPTEVFQQLVDSPPDESHFQGSRYGLQRGTKPGKIRDGSVNRYSLDLIQENLVKLSAESQFLWRSVRDAMGSVEVKRRVFDLLSPGLAHRFGIPESAVPQDVVAFPKCTLMRESDGYGIKPHPDGSRKIVTLQLSLSQDDTQRALGTSLYRLSCNPVHLLQEPRGFHEVRRYPFLPNTVFSFAVVNTMTMRSWHGREPLPPNSGVRSSLLQIYYQHAEDACPDLAIRHAA